MARRDQDPYGSYRFTLELDNVQVAGFSECTGLQMETKVFEYKEGGNNATTLKFPEHTSYGNVTLKRGITKSNELIDWQLEVVNGTFGTNPRAQTPNIAIVLMDEAGNAVKRWNLIRAFPVKWVGPDLKANASEVAIETLELAHEGIQRGQT
ncbi:MAG: phage tail protein [Anaerolineae bacterium]